MTSIYEPTSEAQKLRALRQIQLALGRSEWPTLRACGLSESEARFVIAERLIGFVKVEDDGEYLDMFRVQVISESGFEILNRGDVVEPLPVPVAMQLKHESVWSQILRVAGNKLWEVVIVALGIPVAIFVGWFLWKHHWK